VSGLKVLFIGGSGVISSACSALAVESGIDLHVLNRGRTTIRPLPPGATEIRGDINGDRVPARDDYDAVVNWVAFSPEQVLRDVELFHGKTRQYVFISSASAYQTPPSRVPVTESTPLRNPFWRYSRDKIACEDALTAAYREDGFPVTIVRPSHTYDRTLVPFDGDWTVLGRMLAGKPVIVHGDGTSLWTLTHHADFARAFVPLLGHPRTIGEAFHITSDDVLTWDQIAGALASALGVTSRIVHVPSDAIAAADPSWGAGLLGDKAHSMVFDNSKIRSVVPGWRAGIPFERGAREIVSWYLADPARQVTDERLDAVMDKLAEQFSVILWWFLRRSLVRPGCLCPTWRTGWPRFRRLRGRSRWSRRRSAGSSAVARTSWGACPRGAAGRTRNGTPLTLSSQWRTVSGTASCGSMRVRSMTS
jgi:nucleoside-diphosphate-sugar epimerase